MNCRVSVQSFNSCHYLFRHTCEQRWLIKKLEATKRCPLLNLVKLSAVLLNLWRKNAKILCTLKLATFIISCKLNFWSEHTSKSSWPPTVGYTTLYCKGRAPTSCWVTVWGSWMWRASTPTWAAFFSFWPMYTVESSRFPTCSGYITPLQLKHFLSKLTMFTLYQNDGHRIFFIYCGYTKPFKQ